MRFASFRKTSFLGGPDLNSCAWILKELLGNSSIQQRPIFHRKEERALIWLIGIALYLWAVEDFVCARLKNLTFFYLKVPIILLRRIMSLTEAIAALIYRYFGIYLLFAQEIRLDLWLSKTTFEACRVKRVVIDDVRQSTMLHGWSLVDNFNFANLRKATLVEIAIIYRRGGSWSLLRALHTV